MGYSQWGGVGYSQGAGVSQGQGVVGDPDVRLANAGEGAVDGFGVGGDGLGATERPVDALLGGSDSWGVDGKGPLCLVGDRGRCQGGGDVGVGGLQY